MAMKLGMITIDSRDPLALARWWAEQTGAGITQEDGDAFVVVEGGGLPLMLAVQKVDEPTPGKNRVHLDLAAADLDGEVERLLSVGATLVARRGDESFRWVTLADPDGNQFDVASHL